MRRDSTPRFLAVLAAALCIALLAVSSYAQYQTGNIYGKAQAKDGSVLPGVTVTLTGVGAPQTTVTDAQGNFRFLNLSPGTYSLKGELSGYGSAIRSGVGVRVAQNADVSLTLNPSVSESITVTAEAPLLDIRKAGTGTNVPKVELEKIPTSRDPWTVLQSVPSVMVDRINVGGTQSGQQSNYIAKGALGRDNSWNVDGVNITDMGATGSSPTYFDFDSFEEMQVTTGGSDPRIQTPGVQLNMVTKRGTNDFRGSGRYLYTPESLSDKASLPTEAQNYLARTNGVQYIRDYGAELGGPILRDHLWFWGARADQKISVWQSQGLSLVGSPAVLTPAFLIPDRTILRNKNFKLNGQITASNSAVGFYTFGDKFRNARNLSPTRPFETAYKQTGPTKVYKLEDTQIIGSSLYLTGMWSKISGGFGLFANGGQGLDAPSLWRDADGVNHDNFFTYITQRPQKQYRLDGSKFFDIGKMNHEFKFGFGYRHTPVESTSTLPGPATGFLRYDVTGTAANLAPPSLCSRQGLPEGCFRAQLIRPVDVAFNEQYRDYYIGDTILMGNLTVQAGLRWDRQQSTNTSVSIGANPILATPLTLPCSTALKGTGVCNASGNLTASLPAATYSGDPQSLRWNSVAPRLGLTYSLGADKRTLFRAGYNRYISQQGSAVSGANPLAYSAFYFYGVDANGDHTIQRSELLKIRNYTGVDPANPTAIAITRRVDYGMKVPYSDEFLVGVERELFTDFSMGVNYTYRKYNDLFVTRFEKTPGKGDYYTAADYEPVLCAAAAGCGSGPSKVAQGQQLLAGGTVTLKDPISGNVITTFTTSVRPVFQLKAGIPTPTYRVLTNRENYSQKFGGFELTATKRLSHRWMVRANASYNDYTEDCGANAQAGSGANPTQTLGACPGGQVAPQSAGSGAFGNDFINSKWNFNITGLFVAPWDINLGASLAARQGYPAPLRDNVTGTRGGDLAVVLDDIGTIRFSNVYELDLRVAKDFRIANRMGLTLSADLFNAPNKRTVLQRDTLVLQNEAIRSSASSPGGSGWRITELQAPRVWRMGAKITF